MDEAEEVDVASVVAGCEAAEVFGLVEASLDASNGRLHQRYDLSGNHVRRQPQVITDLLDTNTNGIRL